MSSRTARTPNADLGRRRTTPHSRPPLADPPASRFEDVHLAAAAPRAARALGPTHRWVRVTRGEAQGASPWPHAACPCPRPLTSSRSSHPSRSAAPATQLLGSRARGPAGDDDGDPDGGGRQHPVAGIIDSTLPGIAPTTPQEIGDGSTADLLYANVTEGLSQVDAARGQPERHGRADLPARLPKGRGMTPDVSLTLQLRGRPVLGRARLGPGSARGRGRHLLRRPALLRRHGQEPAVRQRRERVLHARRRRPRAQRRQGRPRPARRRATGLHPQGRDRVRAGHPPRRQAEQLLVGGRATSRATSATTAAPPTAAARSARPARRSASTTGPATRRASSPTRTATASAGS